MTSPIGVFDSGLGGLSVARRIIEALPEERIIYFADNAHVPYGERPLDEIRGFALDITSFLIDNGAKAVVMACNMSSAVALGAARERHPGVPILGMIEPGAKAAVSIACGRPIGVLATTGTVKSGAYERAITALCPEGRVVQQPCPKFVPLVESGKADSEEAEAAARDYVASLTREGCTTIILGCTHYPFLRRAIEAAAGPEVTIVDPAEEVMRALGAILKERRMESDSLREAHKFCTSGDTDDFAALGSTFLGKHIEAVRRVRWGVDLSAGVKVS
ncbi:MAG: glutamate racemase [Armatimonadetes bacterium]|nr:glutamate racemase [Armatimonadota bacterium]